MIVPETIKDWHGNEQFERPFNWDGEIHQEAMIEAFVVKVTDEQVNFVVTHYDPKNDYEFNEYGGYDSVRYNSAGRYKSWSNQFPKRYREILQLVDAEYDATAPEINRTDSALISSDTPELTVGDFIHIHELLLWEVANERGSKSGQRVLDICKLPKQNESPDSFFERTAQLRPRIARQLIRSMAKEEKMRMNQQNRIVANEPFRPFEDPVSTFVSTEWNSVKSHLFRSRNVFGSGPVQDHFVDITAKPAGDYFTELGGIQNFTRSGRHLFTPNVLPFGEGSQDDPLHVVRVAIYSTTVLNPAIGEQRAYLTIDGVKYDLLQNAEESSHYFEEAGHHIVFEGVRQEGVEHDTYEITPEQSEALRQRHQKEMNVAGAILNKAYQDLIDGGEMADLATLEEQAEERIAALRAESNEINKTIGTILGVKPIFGLSSGAHLLIPQSMLDAIEITLSGID